MTLAHRLAEFVVQTPASALSATAMERAKMSLASTIASAAAGFQIESTRIIRQIALDDSGAPRASVWFDGTKLPLAAAARVNAVASDAAASDDSDLRSIAHIGTIASTTGIAVAEQTGSTGADILAAMVLGYEISGRIDEALTPGRIQRGFHGSWSTTFSAAVTAGRLMQLTVPQMAQAIAIAATSIGGMAIAADTSWAREYHAGCSVTAGVQAALAARQGFQAELAVLEKPRGFLDALGAQDVAAIGRDLGSSWDIVTDMAIKLMPGAHPFHATAEAAADAGQTARAAGVAPDDIDGIMISAAIQWTHFKGHPHPRNLVDAAHSLHYFVAAAIADGSFGWQHVAEAKMADPVIARLQDLISFDPAPPPLPDRFTHHHGGSIIIRTKDGREFRSTCKAPRGSGPRGVEWADVEAKYRTLVPQSGLPPATIEASLALIKRLDSVTAISELTGLLTGRGGKA
jgi:2-methylcitrate dehydratase PrpD